MHKAQSIFLPIFLLTGFLSIFLSVQILSTNHNAHYGFDAHTHEHTPQNAPQNTSCQIYLYCETTPYDNASPSAHTPPAIKNSRHNLPMMITLNSQRIVLVKARAPPLFS